MREQQQQASANVYVYPHRPDRPMVKAYTTGPDVVDAIIRARADDLAQKEGYLKKREADLYEREKIMEEREQVLEEERKSMEEERTAMEEQRKSISAKEKALDQVTKNLKNLEKELIELRSAEFQRKPGDPPLPVGRMRSPGWRYGVSPSTACIWGDLLTHSQATERLMQVFGERALGIDDLALRVDFSSVVTQSFISG